MIDKIYNFFNNQNFTISVCESITGGALSHKLISRAGSSKFFKGSVVVYNDEIKSKILDIDLKKIKKFSAVSKEISYEMAKSVKKIFNTDFSISTTGNAGPLNYDDLSKTGQVFITIITPYSTLSKEYYLIDNRSKNIQNTVNFALEFLYESLKK